MKKANSTKPSKRLSPLSKKRALKSTPAAFVKRIQNFLKKEQLFPSGSRILVAVSGGPDSMALLHTLAILQKKYRWTLGVAHVNYGLRGQESNGDARLVQATAKALGLPFYQLKRKVSKKSEEALRTIRYTFFESVAKKHAFDFVALAHHQDDQAETVLMRLLRGSGTLGLSGMPVTRGRYVRPFLRVSKKEILAFLQQKNISYRLDRTNQENIYFRNRIRNELLPLLETYNPQVKKVLAATAETLQAEAKVSKISLPHLFTPQPKKGMVAEFSTWQQLSKGEQAASLRKLFQDQKQKLPTKALLATLLQDLSSTPKKGLDKEYSRLKLRINNGMIHIRFKDTD